jgi:Coenzyme PQQ synthesis protein D (PqqD)
VQQSIPLSLRSGVVASKSQVHSELAGEAVILDLDRGIYYGLDEVGSRIWSLVQEPRTLHSVVDLLIDEFDVPRAQCEQDLMTLIGQLSQAGLVSVTDAGK